MSSESKGDEEGEDRALIEKEDGTIEKSDGALDLGLGDDARQWAATACCSNMLLLNMVVSCVAPVYPIEARKSNTGNIKIEVGAFFAAIQFASLLTSPLASWLCARVSRRCVAIVGGIVFAASTCVLGFAPMIIQPPDLVFFGCRVLQGIGMTFVEVAIFAICISMYPPTQTSTVLGAIERFSGVGYVIGPALGGITYHYVGWTWTFVAIASMVAVNVLLMLRYLLDDRELDEDTRASETMSTSSDFLSLRSSMWWPLAALTVTMAILSFTEAMVPLHIYDTFQYDTQAIGGLFVVPAAAFVLTSITVGAASEWLDPKIAMSGGMFLSSVGVSLIFVDRLPIIICGFLLVGLGAGAVASPVLPVLKAMQPDRSEQAHNELAAAERVTILTGLGLGALGGAGLASVTSLYNTSRFLALAASLVGLPGYLYSAGFHTSFPEGILPSFNLGAYSGEPSQATSPQSPGTSEISTTKWRRSIMVSSNGEPFFVYSLRWVLLLGVSASSFVGGMLSLGFATFAKEYANYYSVGSTFIDLLALLFNLTPIILYFPAMWLCDNVGIRSCAVMGSVFMVLGVLLRLMAITPGLSSYLILFVGTLLVAMGCPFFWDIPVALATRWFPEPERATAMSVGSVAKFMGIGTGMVLPAAVAPSDMQNHLSWILGYHAVLGVCTGVLCLTAFVDQPPEPPGLVDIDDSARVEKYSVATAFNAVFHSGYVWLLFIPVAIAAATSSMLLISIDSMQVPTEHKTLFIGLFFAVGIVSTAILTVFNVMKDRLDLLLSRLMFALASSFVILAVGEGIESSICVAVGVPLAGMVALPMVGLALKLAVRITLTKQLKLEGTVAAYLDLLSCLFTAILFTSTDASIIKSSTVQMSIYVGLLFLSTLMAQALARRKLLSSNSEDSEGESSSAKLLGDPPAAVAE